MIDHWSGQYFTKVSGHWCRYVGSISGWEVPFFGTWKQAVFAKNETSDAQNKKKTYFSRQQLPKIVLCIFHFWMNFKPIWKIPTFFTFLAVFPLAQTPLTQQKWFNEPATYSYQKSRSKFKTCKNTDRLYGHRDLDNNWIFGCRPEQWSIFQGDGMAMAVFLQRWNGDGHWKFSPSPLMVPGRINHWRRWFLSDPGKPGVRSLGPDVRQWVSEWVMFLKLNWCHSGWWRYQLNTNW